MDVQAGTTCRLGSRKWRVASGVMVGLIIGSVATLVAACGSSLEDSARGTDGPAVVVDPRAARVGSVTLHDPLERFDAAFGPRVAAPPASDVTWWKLGTPGTYGFPAACAVIDPPSPAPRHYYYRGAEVELCRGDAFLIIVTGRGSRTTAGAKIGEPLGQAAARHPGLRCETSTANTSDPPQPVYRYCSGRVAANRYLWLGQDPVSSIALATVPLA